MESPLPTKRQAAFAIRYFMPIMLLQKGEALLGEWWASQLSRILYFSLKTLIQRQSFSDRIHQPSLGRRAWLKSQNFLNPKPPSFCGQQREDQDIRVQYEPAFDLGLHQNLCTDASNWSQRPFGNKIADIEYVGMAWATDLIKVALLDQDIFLLFHPLSLLSNLSLTNMKSWDLLFDKKRGTPR